MTDFDPAIHKIVAVVTDGPEKGQHFHVTLPDLAREVMEIDAESIGLGDVTRRLANLEAGNKAVVRVERTEVERLPDEHIALIERIKAELERFQASQEFVMPKAFQELIERVGKVEAVVGRLAEQAARAKIETTAHEPNEPSALEARLVAVEEFITTRAVDDLAEALKMMRLLMAEVDRNKRLATAQFDIALNRTDELAVRVHSWTMGQTG
jgi:hypothetical protein